MMSTSLVLACIWGLAANGAGMMPERFHWPAAYALTALGIPLVGYVTLENGPVWGLIALAAGASVLRWPLFYFTRHLARPWRRHRAEK
jgi:hypothetical protein